MPRPPAKVKEIVNAEDRAVDARGAARAAETARRRTKGTPARRRERLLINAAGEPYTRVAKDSATTGAQQVEKAKRDKARKKRPLEDGSGAHPPPSISLSSGAPVSMSVSNKQNLRLRESVAALPHF